MFKKIICLVLNIVLIVSLFSGCRRNNTEIPKADGHVLTIAYDNSKYGSKWIEAIAAAYKKENPQIKLVLRADSNLGKKAGTLLRSYSKAPDIMFLPNTSWEYWASEGSLEDLTDLYGTAVDGGKKLENKVVPQVLRHCSYKGRYFAVPWDSGVTGFIYNESLFKKYGWDVPKTMGGLFELLPKIKSAGIIPLAWDGKDIGDWNYAVDNWWAQSVGRSGMTAYLKMDSPEVYLQNGRVNALREFNSFTGTSTNSPDGVISMDSAAAQKLFFTSKAAMLLSGSWITCGAAIPHGFKMGLMRFPTADGATNDKINVMDAGGIAVISAYTQHAGVAKDFLRFTSSDKMLSLYTKITSSPRPFSYDAESTPGLSPFGESVMSVYSRCDNFYMFSSSFLYYGVFSDWPSGGSPFIQLFYGMTSPQKAVTDNYLYVKSNWNSAVKKVPK